MSNNKQSSVEWLGYELNTLLFYDLSPKLWKEVDNLFKQAKEMHKKEIEDAYYNGGSFEDLTKNEILLIAEQYYNETFAKKIFLDLVSDEESQVHEVVRKLKEKKEETLCKRIGHLPNLTKGDNACMVCKEDITEWLKSRKL